MLVGHWTARHCDWHGNSRIIHLGHKFWGQQGKIVDVNNFDLHSNRLAKFTELIINQSNCPRGSNAEATVGTTKIYFIHVRSNLPRTGENIIYSIVDVCVGGQEYNEVNLKAISNVLDAYPSNKIDDRYRGPAQTCTLPKADVENEYKQGATSDDPNVPKNAGKTEFQNIMSLGITSLLIMATIIVAY
jgi:hypothetical protein